MVDDSRDPLRSEKSRFLICIFFTSVLTTYLICSSIQTQSLKVLLPTLRTSANSFIILGVCSISCLCRLYWGCVQFNFLNITDGFKKMIYLMLLTSIAYIVVHHDYFIKSPSDTVKALRIALKTYPNPETLINRVDFLQNMVQLTTVSVNRTFGSGDMESSLKQTLYEMAFSRPSCKIVDGYFYIKRCLDDIFSIRFGLYLDVFICSSLLLIIQIRRELRTEGE